MIENRKKIIYRRKNKKPIYKKKWFWKIILIILFVSILLWFFFKASYFEIKKIEISCPNKFKETIGEVASLEKNFFLFDESRISGKIKKKFPEIKRIIVKKHFPSTIFIEVEQRKNFGVFCKIDNPSSCFSISNDGVIYKRQKPEEGLLFFGKTRKNLKVGDRAIEKDLLDEIIYLIKELKGMSIFPVKIEILDFEIRVITKNNFRLYFSKENLKDQVDIFTIIFKEKIPRKDKKHLKYVDMRSLEEDNKGAVYWK